MRDPAGRPANSPAGRGKDRHDRVAFTAFGAAFRHPALWPVIVRLIPRGWWRRWPPRPIPTGPYTEFRLETMYGRGRGPDDDDLIRYLEWCRRMAPPAR
jgi:hypothetical protein